MTAKLEVTEEDLNSFHDAAVSLAREGGEVVRKAISDRHKRVEAKSSQVDLVTETDRAVEKLLFDGLRWDKRRTVFPLQSIGSFYT